MQTPSALSRTSRLGRFLGVLLLTAAAFSLFLVLLGFLFSPEVLPEAIEVDDAVVARMQALRASTFDADYKPQNFVAVDYTEGQSAAWYPKGQSKVLDPAVAEGALPAVAERTGPEPVVLQGPDGIGKYGGTWIRLSTTGDHDIIRWRLSGSNLVRWSPMGYPIVPHVAKGWEVNEDASEWTFHLREGMRWSDGHPFTTEDVRYYWEKEQASGINGELAGWLKPNGEPGELIVKDATTFTFKFKQPYGAFLELLASHIHTLFYAPAHYLEQFHPDYGNPDIIEEYRAKHGLADAKAVYNSARSIMNPECPRLWPWIPREQQKSPPLSFVRNPYYFAVDEAGNQLPYIDRVVFEVKHPSLIPVAAAAGGATMQGRNLTFDNYTLLLEGMEPGGYDVYHWFNASRSVWTVWPNLNRAVVENDPASKWKAEYLNKKEFRQALSLAINRQNIIDSVFHGIGEPAQLDPGRESPYHNEKLFHAYTDFDPERANHMLDAIGLEQRDASGMRAFPDGTPMTWYLDYTSFTGEGPAQFVIDDWRRVGVRVVYRERARPLYTQERAARLQDFSIWTGESEFNPLVMPRSFVASEDYSLFASAYGRWFSDGGMFEKAKDGSVLEPPKGSVMRQNQEYLLQLYNLKDEQERIDLFSKIAANAAEEVWSISIATAPPFLIVVDKDLRNVPRMALYGAPYNSPANTGIETYFFENNEDSEAVIAQIAGLMAAPMASKYTLDSENREYHVSWSSRISALIPWLWTSCLLGFLILMATKHPYIARRLFIMVPTLFIVSIIVFVVIQMPPGNYVETKILQLQMDGDSAAVAEAERLTDMFHLEDPVWKQYLHWAGFKWFVTYDPGDRGLLQGELGISMQSLQSVNDTVESRALLTMTISLFTVLFTWAVALPIGIYTAVRQYSIADYVLTFLGFIGMCVPNFLLAILLMYWANKYLGMNVTGLFSPEYATTPEWSMGKVLDMMGHLVVPIIVIGTAGTAGMIRVMRANLLDELRKPYVTTAMAKGVRPFKLLIKYPVRLAINPFISGIGGLFPAMLSGSSITAIILALPTIGPLLLDGLLLEDFYLAGSLLMVFSLLGIAGTLVSDILLLLVDPRIRMEGGSK